MGNTVTQSYDIAPNPNRKIFITFMETRYEYGARFGSYQLYDDISRLHYYLTHQHPTELNRIQAPIKRSYWFSAHDAEFLNKRALLMTKYLQEIVDQENIFSKSIKLQKLLNISHASFRPEMGRKGKEGYLLKCSGGYHEKFSWKAGDYIKMWRWRWVVLKDNCICWYRSPEDPTLKGVLQIDQALSVDVIGRTLKVATGTRSLAFQASTIRQACEWRNELLEFYNGSPRKLEQPFMSSFPIRQSIDVRPYINGRDYFKSLAYALLTAQKEIFIASWKNSPTVLLTRPPLPPLRFDQILKFKAQQGIQIYILLYKEVEYVGNSNDSLKAKQYLESLSKNIHCIRHPNKILGGSTAVLWSHHEKLAVIDRSIAFVGGIDISFTRWDDELHRIVDEDGIIYPGKEYRQPAPGLFKPARPIVANKKRKEEDASSPYSEIQFEDDEIEVFMGNESLPYAETNSIFVTGSNEVVHEVEVLDLGMNLSDERFSTLASERAEEKTSPREVDGRSHSHLNPDDLIALDESNRLHQQDPAANDDIRQREWLDMRQVPESAEEMQAKKEAEILENDDAISVRSAAEAKDGHRASIFELLDKGKAQFNASMDIAAGVLAETAKNISETYSGFTKSNPEYGEVRDVFPRMGWHDMQISLSGAAARDVSSHFVQRWNHHRLSALSAFQPVLIDITGELNYTVCARCKTAGISEFVEVCPTCGYLLGPGNPFVQPLRLELCPNVMQCYSYIMFSCLYRKIPFKMQGDCPVVVSKLFYAPYALIVPLSNSSVQSAANPEGTIVDSFGEDTESLLAGGLLPMVGDVIYSIFDQVVTHLDVKQLYRFIRRRLYQFRLMGNSDGFSIPVTFRRHYLEMFHENAKKTAMGVSSSVVDDNNSLMNQKRMDSTPLQITTSNSRNNLSTSHSSSMNAITAVPVEDPEMVLGKLSPNQSSSALNHSSSSPQFMQSELVAEASPDPFPQHIEESSNAVMTKRGKGIEEINPICIESASLEVRLSISHLFHEDAKYFELANRLSDTGTCQVQVLRSIGKWSTGTKTENSIMNCWIDTIRNASKLIYIENQFFIGSLASDGVQNGIAAAILDRILLAHQRKERFKVIIIIPLHPNGDFSNSLKSSVVMHYQYQTICRGTSSLIKQLKEKARDIVVDDYIGFFSLRNHGVLNNKLVIEQIYIHDKILIVDDRVAIIGSANINDRSMVGHRDSEIAVRIEDTFHIDILLDRQPFSVGYFPHQLRVSLMAQHVADQNIDLTDPLNAELFEKNWKSIASLNSSLYDGLEGPLSVYSCTNSNDFKTALENSSLKSYFDPMVREAVSKIKGFLVDYPYNFLFREDLSPSIATRAIIPNELWY